VPKDRTEIAVLLYTYLLDQALEEICDEMRRRPDWARVPLEAALQLLEAPWPS